MKKVITNTFILLALGLTQVFAQTGSIKGTINDKKNGEELVGAVVVIDGTTIGAVTDFMGDFTFPPLEPGTYNLKCQYISYQTQIIKNVTVTANATTQIKFDMAPAEMNLEEVVVMVKAKRESENMLLMEQKSASVSIEAIGAQQLSIQGVSDASSAATKITGVSKQEGSQTLNIRGLGDRYNSTTLNGLPLPSNHAEYKNIDLELFSTDVIEYIGVEKAFSAPLSSDVAGANINVVSKKQSGDPFVQINVKTGSNTSVHQANEFVLQDGPSFGGWTDFNHPNSLKSYDFKNSWNSATKNPSPNISLGMNGGKTFKIGTGLLNTFATASFDNKYGYSKLFEGRVNGSDDIRMNLNGEQYNYNTQSSGMVNLNYSSPNTQLYFNSLVLNSTKQELKQLEGYIIDVVGDASQEDAYLRRSDYERNLILVNQLLGEHTIHTSWKLNWAVGYNSIYNTLPDRRHNVLVGDKFGNYLPSTNDQANNHRYFHQLNEQELASNIKLSKKIGNAIDSDYDYRTLLSIGYAGRIKSRDFEAYQYNHALNKDQLENIDPQDIDAYFNNNRMQDGYFELRTFFGNLNVPQTYGGQSINHAVFASAEYNVTKRLLAVIGIRFENIYQKVEYKTSLKNGENNFQEMNTFPSLSLKYALTPKSNLRFASSTSYTLPQFKETAPFLFESITDATVGNPYLYPSKVLNAELKWELFPELGQLISVAAFGKYINNPINKFVMASASNDFTFANTGDWGYVMGAEMEVKKPVLSTAKNKVLAGANLSLMESKQELNNDKIKTETQGSINAAFDKQEETLQGAAPLLANANLSYSHNWSPTSTITSTVVYGYTSDRLYLLGYAGLGNQVDKSFNQLDIIVKYQQSKLGINLSAKNILNQNIERVQENNDKTHLVSSYKKGVDISIELTYKF